MAQGQGGEGCRLPLWGTQFTVPPTQTVPPSRHQVAVFCFHSAVEMIDIAFPFPELLFLFPRWTFPQHGYERFVLCTVEVVLSTWTSACLICEATSQ